MIDVLVTGMSLPALQTALDLAEVGMSVTVLAGDGEVGEVAASKRAERDPSGAIAAFMTRIATPVDSEPIDLASPAAPTYLDPHPPMLHRQGAWLPQAEPAVLGVPAVPLAEQTIALLGQGAAFRAYLDRVTPLLTVGKTKFFGELIRKRMGAKTRDRLVDPQVFERFGAMSDGVDVAIAAPGLNEALSRAGALSSAVLAYSDRNVARETRVGPAGGAEAFAEAVRHRLEIYAVSMLPSAPVAVERDESGEGGWAVRIDSGETIRARALVIDAGAEPVTGEAFEGLIGSLAPREGRVYAEIDMQRPEWAASGTQAVALSEGWAVRVENETTAIVSGAAVPVAELPGAVAELKRPGLLSQVLGGVGLKALDSAATEAAESAERSEPRVATSAAPYRTLEDRDRASAELSAFIADQPSLLPVGRALHGDDLGAALEHAHEASVHLRRMLLGLEA